MAAVSELKARVATTYEGLHLPAWPDPHSGMTSPRDEEYSRVTDPERSGGWPTVGSMKRRST